MYFDRILCLQVVGQIVWRPLSLRGDANLLYDNLRNLRQCPAGDFSLLALAMTTASGDADGRHGLTEIAGITSAAGVFRSDAIFAWIRLAP